MSYIDKKNTLIHYLNELMEKPVIVAFSGGVDSSLLLKLCCEAAQKTNQPVHAVTIHSKLHPFGDLEIAKRVAEETGAIHHIIQVDELEAAGIRFNPPDRCYLCKKHLFGQLKEKANTLGTDTIIEGTNADDLLVYRPGIRALKELGILSPLAVTGISKEEVRKMASEYGISVSNRPSAPCMATRFPYGTELDYAVIRKVEQCENWLKDQGFYNVRIRVHDTIARIEIDPDQMTSFLSRREEILSAMKIGRFDYITLDLEGFRSGSMDLKIAPSRSPSPSGSTRDTSRNPQSQE